jgi:hypothetical protein
MKESHDACTAQIYSGMRQAVSLTLTTWPRKPLQKLIAAILFSSNNIVSELQQLLETMNLYSL